MQIKNLMQLDFKEVFPTIVGDKDWMLSIDDLLDTSHTYIIEELNNISENVNQAEKNELISFLTLMDEAEGDIIYDSHVHFLLKRFAEKYPDYKTFRFCEFMYVLDTIISNTEITLEFMTNFYNKVLSDRTLMNLTDFIQASGLGNSLILLNDVYDDLVSILEDAIPSYPQKIILLWITANLYRVQGKYQVAIKYYKQFLEKLESNPKEEFDLDFVDAESELMVSFQLADINFDIGDFSESMNYCKKLQVLDRDKENSSFYYDSVIIRIRIHMNSNHTSSFQQDYNELLKAVTEEELKKNYSDILDYADLMNIQPSSD